MTKVKITQGDVTFFLVDEIPKEAVRLTTKVVQPSETHGKYHRFADTAQVNVYETGRDPGLDLSVNFLSPDSGRYVEVLSPNGAVLYHGKEFDLRPVKETGTDHNALPLPQGLWKVGIASELSPLHDEEVAGFVVD